MDRVSEAGAPLQSADLVSTPWMTARRSLFASLVVATMAGLVWLLTGVFSGDGLSWIEIGMIAFFTLNLPWLVIGFWNAVIGVLLLHLDRDWLRTVVPIDGLGDAGRPIEGRVAVVMPVYNEDPARSIRHLRTIAFQLEASGKGGHYELFLLSDSDDPATFAEEHRLFEEWRAIDPRPERLHYRRREDNVRQKVGNLEDFWERWGDRFDHMIVLDADSLMSADAILRITRLIEANPRLGILQTLVTGMPATSAFARMFQFGMRHGMRSYTTGSAWWQGDSGPYWGHNAIIRLAPFRRYCRLPRLSGNPPLGGEILSHDQVEAVLMRRAGYEVRVLPIEDGSFEENPTTLPDFMKRDLRWCQGNMQYLRLLHWPGLRPLGRVQLVLAILMYLGAPFWYGFMGLGLVQIVVAATVGAAETAPTMDGPFFATTAANADGLTLFGMIMVMIFAPKILGVLDVLLRPAERRRYGGAAMIVAGLVVETLFSMLISPIVALAQAIFIAGLFVGRRIRWVAQERDDRSVPLTEAVSGLWKQGVVGLVFVAVFALWAPGMLVWAAPVVSGLLLAIPFACVTSMPALGRWMTVRGLCAVPEERDPPEVLRQVGFHPPTRGLAITPAAAVPVLDSVGTPERQTLS